jgi:hypothetical protein
MTLEDAKTLTDAQSLIYGGLMSLASAIFVVLLQTLFQERRERYLERRATRERFSAYDLAKLKALEEALLECSRHAQQGLTPDRAFDRIDEALLTASPDPRAQKTLFNSFFFEFKPRVFDLINAQHAVPQGDRLKVFLMKDPSYSFALGVLESAIVDFIRLFRAEALGEEAAKKRAGWFSRLRGPGRAG